MPAKEQRAKQRHFLLAMSKTSPITLKKKKIVERKIHKEGQKRLSKGKKPQHHPQRNKLNRLRFFSGQVRKI